MRDGHRQQLNSLCHNAGYTQHIFWRFFLYVHVFVCLKKGREWERGKWDREKQRRSVPSAGSHPTWPQQLRLSKLRSKRVIQTWSPKWMARTLLTETFSATFAGARLEVNAVGAGCCLTCCATITTLGFLFLTFWSIYSGNKYTAKCFNDNKNDKN